MAEKKLNVRIQNKLDTYENWIANDPVLKAGEIAFATVSVAQDGTINTVPSVLAKIGDGTHKFSELGWLYSRASDVATWAKASVKPTYAASEITGIDSYIADYVNDQMGISVDTDTQYQLVKVNDYSYKLQSKGKTDSAWADVAGSVITIPDDTAAITALQTLVGDTAVATQIANAITKAKSDLIGLDSDNADSDTIKGAKKYADSLNTAMDTRVDALETAVGSGGSVDTKIADAIGALDVTDNAEDGKYVSAVSEADGKITVTRAALPDYTNTYDAKGAAAQALTDAKDYANGLNTAMDTRMDAAEGKLTTLIGSDADKSVRTIANEELAAQLIPETAKDSLDTLQEIAAWIQAHPDDASAMNGRIAALETQVGDDPVSTQISAAIDALKIGDYAKAADLTAAVSRIAANETAIATLNGSGKGSVSKTVSDAVAALDVKDSAVKHQFVTSVSETDGKIAVTRAAITTDDLAQGTDVLVFDCGSSSVNV